MPELRSERGFGIYAEEIKTRHEETLSVRESSLAFEGAHVRIYVNGHVHQMIADGFDGKTPALICAHMNVAQTKELIAALQEFIDEAEAGELTEPAEAEEDECDDG